ncbi:MAG TPA: hypothetical protein VHO67_06035 [Polyangia bacterium]|nr:hypothetical protein [Polyangia bacterium]
MRIVRKVIALCAVVALAAACLAADPTGTPGDDGDDEVTLAFDLSAALPASRGEPAQVTLAAAGAVFVEDQAPQGRLPELDIFRPPRRATV